MIKHFKISIRYQLFSVLYESGFLYQSRESVNFWLRGHDFTLSVW